VQGGAFLEKLGKLLYAAAIIAILYFLFPFFIPFILAIVIAVLFEPVILWLSKKTKLNRMAASVSVITVFFIGTGYVSYISISKIVKEVVGFAKKVPSFLQTTIQDNEKLYKLYYDLPQESREYILNSADTMAKKLTTSVSDAVPLLFTKLGQFSGYFIALIIFVIATYIISLELPRLKPTLLRYFESGKSQKKVHIALDKLKKAIVGFLRAQIILTILTFLITLVGAYIIDIKYAITFSVIVILVDLLPIFGTGMVLVPWAIYSFVIGSAGQGIGLLILFGVITVFRRALEPKLIADTIGLNPLATLVSMYVGLEVMGIIGMIVFPMILMVAKALEEARLIRIKLKI